MYWWRVIHGMKSEWEYERSKSDSGDGAGKKGRSRTRRKPVLPSKRGKK